MTTAAGANPLLLATGGTRQSVKAARRRRSRRPLRACRARLLQALPYLAVNLPAPLQLEDTQPPHPCPGPFAGEGSYPPG